MDKKIEEYQKELDKHFPGMEVRDVSKFKDKKHLVKHARNQVRLTTKSIVRGKPVNKNMTRKNNTWETGVTPKGVYLGFIPKEM